jgi:hypothetical protein
MNVWGAAIGGKWALYHSKCTVPLNAFGQAGKFLAIGQRGPHGLSDRTAAKPVGDSDSLRSTELKFFNACFKFV